MAPVKAIHNTVVMERKFKSSPEKVFAAWADPAAHGHWNVPGEDWVIAEFEQDFRVGGRLHSFFGPKGSPRYRSEGHFLNIAENQRIISAGTMHDGNIPMSSTMCTVEIQSNGRGTHLILTDQSAYFQQGETPEDRSSGWGQILKRLASALAEE